MAPSSLFNKEFVMQSRSEQILRRFLFVSALALAVPAGSAFAQSLPADGGSASAHQMGEHSWGDSERHGHDNMMRKLNLSADQQKQIRLLRDAQQDAIRPLVRDLREQRISLRELVSADQYDAKKAGEISEKIGKLQGQLVLAATEGHRKVLDVLTPEQRAHVKDIPFGHGGMAR